MPFGLTSQGVLGILLLFIFLPNFASGQSHASRNITVNDGLASSSVYRILQDFEGYIWFLTNKGVSKFNGREFVNFTNSDGLGSNENWEGQVGEDGSIWINSFGPVPYNIVKGVVKKPYLPPEIAGLGLYKNHTCIRQGAYLYFDAHFSKMVNQGLAGFGILNDTVFALEPADPEIQLLTFYGLEPASFRNTVFGQFMFEGEKEPRMGIFNFEGKKLNLEYSCLSRDMDQALGRNHDFEITGSIFPIRVYPQTSLSPDSILFFAGEKPVLMTSEGIDTTFNFQFPYPDSKDIIRIFRLGEGFFFKTHGFSFVTDHRFNHLPEYDFINQHNVNSLFIDDKGNLWVATSDEGAYLYPQNFSQTVVYHFDQLAGSDNIVSLAKAQEDQLLVALENQELILHDHYRDLRLPKPIFSDESSWVGLRKILIHPRFGLLIATLNNNFWRVPAGILEKGIENFVVDDYLLWSEELDYNMGGVKSLSQLDSSLLFCGNTGVNVLTWQNPNKVLRKKIPSYYTVYATVVGADGTYWMGTQKGLTNDLVQHPFLLAHRHHPLLHAPVTVLTKDKFGNIFAGTDGFGVYMLNQDTLLHFEATNNSIVSDLFYAEEYDRLLVGSNRGVRSIDLRSGMEYATQVLTTAHGLPSDEVNCLTVLDGKACIGTNQGLAVIAFPIASTKDRTPPRFYLTEVYVNGEARSNTEELVLPYDSNYIDLNFSGISHESGPHVTYQYRILPSDTNWRKAGEPVISLASLSPGSYRVQMRMKDISDNVSEVAAIKIKIKRAFWNTHLFRLLVLVLLVIGLSLFYESRARKARRKREATEAIQKRFSELELQALRSQINPHFIFNLLNSFQRIIIQEDFLLANEYLGKFARLMRMTLDSSRRQTVVLAKELEILELYAGLEQLRFRERFSFLMEVEEEVDVDGIEIPSLIIQPFLENAIVHGMKHLGAAGQVSLRLFMEEEVLVVTVEDNGGGIDHAQPEERKGHISSGIAIIQDRIAVLGQMNGIRVEVNTIDLGATVGSSGTRVEIRFYQNQVT